MSSNIHKKATGKIDIFANEPRKPPILIPPKYCVWLYEVMFIPNFDDDGIFAQNKKVILAFENTIAKKVSLLILVCAIS